MPITTNKFLLVHFFASLVALITISIILLAGDVDRHLADYFYSLQGGRWAWKNRWITETFFHKGGRALSEVLALMLVALLLAAWFHPRLVAHKKSLLYLLLAVAGGSLLVSLFKAFLAVPCPWEFERYGGNLVYGNLVSQLFSRSGSGCFPAGHASAGYAWMQVTFLVCTMGLACAGRACLYPYLPAWC